MSRRLGAVVTVTDTLIGTQERRVCDGDVSEQGRYGDMEERRDRHNGGLAI